MRLPCWLCIARAPFGHATGLATAYLLPPLRDAYNDNENCDRARIVRPFPWKGHAWTRTTANFLVVDDEPSITDFRGFKHEEGYEVDIADAGDTAGDGTERQPFLVILDVMLPGIDGSGMPACRRATCRCCSSARDTELDKVVGLELGGDDYLAKPFRIRFLPACTHPRAKVAPRRSAC